MSRGEASTRGGRLASRVRRTAQRLFPVRLSLAVRRLPRDRSAEGLSLPPSWARESTRRLFAAPRPCPTCSRPQAPRWAMKFADLS